MQGIWQIAQRQSDIDSFVPDANSKVVLVLGDKGNGQSQILARLLADLTKPESLFKIKYWLEEVRNSIEQYVRNLSPQKAGFYTRKIIQQRLPSQSLQTGVVEPILANVCVVGSKYDMFENQQPRKRKQLARIIRFLAYSCSASVCFVSMKDKSRFANFQHWIKNQFQKNPLKDELVDDADDDDDDDDTQKKQKEDVVEDDNEKKVGVSKMLKKKKKFQVTEITQISKQLMIEAGSDSLQKMGLKSYRGENIFKILKSEVASVYSDFRDDDDENEYESSSTASAAKKGSSKQDKKTAEFERRFIDFKQAKIDSMRAQKQEQMLQIKREQERAKKFQKPERGGLKVKKGGIKADLNKK